MRDDTNSDDDNTVGGGVPPSQMLGLYRTLGEWMRAWCDRYAGPGPWTDGDLADRALNDVPFGMIRQALRPQLTKCAASWTRPRGVTVATSSRAGATQAETHGYEQLTLALAVEHLRFLDEKIGLARSALVAEAEDMAARLGVDVTVILTAANLRNLA